MKLLWSPKFSHWPPTAELGLCLLVLVGDSVRGKSFWQISFFFVKERIKGGGPGVTFSILNNSELNPNVFLHLAKFFLNNKFFYILLSISASIMFIIKYFSQLKDICFPFKMLLVEESHFNESFLVPRQVLRIRSCCRYRTHTAAL